MLIEKYRAALREALKDPRRTAALFKPVLREATLRKDARVVVDCLRILALQPDGLAADRLSAARRLLRNKRDARNLWILGVVQAQGGKTRAARRAFDAARAVAVDLENLELIESIAARELGGEKSTRTRASFQARAWMRLAEARRLVAAGKRTEAERIVWAVRRSALRRRDRRLALLCLRGLNREIVVEKTQRMRILRKLIREDPATVVSELLMLAELEEGAGLQAAHRTFTLALRRARSENDRTTALQGVTRTRRRRK